MPLRLIVTKGGIAGLMGVTLEWVLWGEGARPKKHRRTTPNRPAVRRSAPPEEPAGQEVRRAQPTGGGLRGVSPSGSPRRWRPI